MSDPNTAGPGPAPVPDHPSPVPPPQPGSALWHLVRSQAGNRPGDATAYLRGAAHIDRAFRDAVLAELAENPHRIPPPSYGVDLAAVLKECYVARRWAAVRAGLLLGIPLLMMPFSVAGALIPPTLVLLARLAMYVGRTLARLVRGDSGTARQGRGAGALLLVLVVLWLAWVPLRALALLPVLLITTLGESGDGAADSTGLGRHLMVMLVVFIGWGAVAAVHQYRTTRLKHLFATGQAPDHPDGTGAIAQRIDQVRRRQADPDVVYSDYAPFVGAGIELDHWSFAIELVPDPTSKTTDAAAAHRDAFTVPDVHARIRSELARLGEGSAYPGDRMHGIRVDDYVMKSGKRLGPVQDWSGTGPDSAFHLMAPAARAAAAVQLRTPPGADVPATWWPDSLDLFAEERLRHYLTVRVGSWGDEVVLTVFSRVQMQGGLLFLESRAFLLPPIARAYHAIDDVLPPSDPADWLDLLRESFASVFALVSDAPGDLFAPSRTSAAAARSEAWYRRMCATDRVVDHGPRYSVRELAAEPHFQQLFQEMDVQRFLKSIQTRTVTAVRAALRDAGYSTGEYDARATIVFDHSVRVDGTVHGNIQTGDHARASHQTITTPQPHVGPRSDGGSTPGS
ncbi:hypothetical protein [Streptomyces sp. NPDC088400]|uniref:hypothetical protein n=1 Tax=Streptomyces sp. NPDC088400 TaxID=3365861 RepID=UPI003813ECA7